jgi:hypothetical protein
MMLIMNNLAQGGKTDSHRLSFCRRTEISLFYSGNNSVYFLFNI